MGDDWSPLTSSHGFQFQFRASFPLPCCHRPFGAAHGPRMIRREGIGRSLFYRKVSSLPLAAGVRGFCSFLLGACWFVTWFVWIFVRLPLETLACRTIGAARHAPQPSHLIALSLAHGICSMMIDERPYCPAQCLFYSWIKNTSKALGCPEIGMHMRSEVLLVAFYVVFLEERFYYSTHSFKSYMFFEIKCLPFFSFINGGFKISLKVLFFTIKFSWTILLINCCKKIATVLIQTIYEILM